MASLPRTRQFASISVSGGRSRLACVPRLHVLTPDAVGADAVAAIRRVVAAGAPLVQVRLKAATDRQALRMIRDVAAATRAAQATCLVNDRADLALAADADGVHLGADDLPVAAARRVLDLDGQRRLVGGTARDVGTARRLVAEGADYLGVGPVHRTTSKPGLPDPIGIAGIREVAAAVEVPVIAIGGIQLDHVADLLGAGAHGVAVLGAVWHRPDPTAAVAELRDAVGRTGVDRAAQGPR